MLDEQATLTATAGTGWNFYEFINGPFWLPGGLGANPKTFYVPDTGNPVNPTAYFSDTPVYTVSVTPDTFSSNLYLYVDSTFEYAPKNFSEYYDSTWTAGSTHSLSVPAAQYPYSFNSRYNFAKWSDGGAMTHDIASLPAKATAYTATVRRNTSRPLISTTPRAAVRLRYRRGRRPTMASIPPGKC